MTHYTDCIYRITVCSCSTGSSPFLKNPDVQPASWNTQQLSIRQMTSYTLYLEENNAYEATIEMIND